MDIFKTEIKVFLIVLVVAVVIAVGAILFLSQMQTSVPAVLNTGEEVKITGTIIERDDGCFVDGTCSLTIDSDHGRVEVITNVGWLACPHDPFVEGDFVDIGSNVEVFGKVDSANTVSACSSPDYYIKSVGFNEPQTIDTSDWQTHRNDQFGYEIKFHPNFMTPGLSDERWAVVYEGEENIPTLAAEFKIDSRRVEEIPEDIKKFFQILESAIPGEEVILNIGIAIKRENINLDSCVATQYLVIKDGIADGYGTYCTYGENQVYFELAFEEEVSSFAKEKAIEFYDQTLSTFRFVE